MFAHVNFSTQNYQTIRIIYAHPMYYQTFSILMYFRERKNSVISRGQGFSITVIKAIPPGT